MPLATSQAHLWRLAPGLVMMHPRRRCVGVVGLDRRLYTHNCTLAGPAARRFRPVWHPGDVPAHLNGRLRVARRRARSARYQ